MNSAHQSWWVYPLSHLMNLASKLLIKHDYMCVCICGMVPHNYSTHSWRDASLGFSLVSKTSLIPIFSPSTLSLPPPPNLILPVPGPTPSHTCPRCLFYFPSPWRLRKMVDCKMGLEANSEVREDRVYYKLRKESVRLSLHEPELYIIAIISKQRLHNAQPASALVNFKWLSELIVGKWSSGRYHMNSLNFCQKTMLASGVTIVSKNSSG